MTDARVAAGPDAALARAAILRDHAAVPRQLADAGVRARSRVGRPDADHPVRTQLQAPISGDVWIEPLLGARGRQREDDEPHTIRHGAGAIMADGCALQRWCSRFAR